jgi:hypothetical protein
MRGAQKRKRNQGPSNGKEAIDTGKSPLSQKKKEIGGQVYLTFSPHSKSKTKEI